MQWIGIAIIVGGLVLAYDYFDKKAKKNE
jgi:hypothetical protein